jgi:hypothetical protein
VALDTLPPMGAPQVIGDGPIAAADRQRRSDLGWWSVEMQEDRWFVANLSVGRRILTG